ncbi:helix-turn-helix domain-containing protein [Ramlibacter sp.]|uniref:helix-turn-helix domain-containing protein n=1 Tax=Ramlibacter sp. TaxID=1917967 RepID=UPI0035B18EB4
MESVKTIRAVERAFEVLRALQARPQGATLIELKSVTGLSGPTLLRLLKTLIAQQAVRRSPMDQRYRNSIQLQGLTRGMTPSERLADVAAPWLDSLCQQVEWPSDLAIHDRDDDYMTVLESSLRQSRFYVRRAPGRVRVNLLGSAAGTAYLAALTESRRRELVECARLGRDPHNAAVIASGDLERRVQEARRIGYARRARQYRGGGYNKPARDDALHAIAVPIVHADWVVGSLNINWNRRALSEREMVARHLPALRAAARGIGASIADLGILPELPGLEAACAPEELAQLCNSP